MKISTSISLVLLATLPILFASCAQDVTYVQDVPIASYVYDVTHVDANGVTLSDTTIIYKLLANNVYWRGKQNGFTMRQQGDTAFADIQFLHADANGDLSQYRVPAALTDTDGTVSPGWYTYPYSTSSTSPVTLWSYDTTLRLSDTVRQKSQEKFQVLKREDLVVDKSPVASIKVAVTDADSLWSTANRSQTPTTINSTRTLWYASSIRYFTRMEIPDTSGGKLVYVLTHYSY